MALVLGTAVGVFHLGGYLAFGLFFAVINSASPYLAAQVLKLNLDAYGGPGEVMRNYGVPSMSTFMYAYILAYNLTV